MSTKTEKKIKAKIVDDKTFGLKNKNKSAKVQQYVKSVKHQVMEGNAKGGAGAAEARKFQEKKDKKKKEEANKLLASLFKGAQNLADQKDAGVDAKTINFYKDPRAGTEDMPDTIITCKYFLDACEDEKYGWRWECPNGPKCPYRHQLPEGYVMLTKKEREAEKKRALEQKDERTLEE